MNVNFIVEHIDIISMGVSLPIIATVLYKIKTPKKYKINNDVTKYAIKHNKCKESLTRHKAKNRILS